MALREVMDPPFDSTWQASGFALLLVVLLMLPVGLSKSGLTSRKDVYERIPERFGAFSYIGNQIFEEKSDIDILFLGSSVLWLGIDTPYVQDELSRRLGRQANVVTFGANWRGEDLTFILLSELLQTRKVRMLVITMPLQPETSTLPHPQAFRWLPYGGKEAAFEGLPLRGRIAVYGEQVLGAPRHLLGLIRRDIQQRSESYDKFVFLRGSYRLESGYFGAPFVRELTRPAEAPASSAIYSAETKRLFHFTQQPLSDYQMHFLKLTVNLLRNFKVPVLIVNIPLSRQRHNPTVEERMYWPDVLGMEMPIVGVPPAILFRGKSDAEIDRFFYNEHMNLNGSELFTRTVTPAILKIYEDYTHRSR